MIDFIRSKSVKKYLEEKQIHIDDKLKYALIVESQMSFPLENIKESLLELAAETDDEEVKVQAPIWIRNEDAEFAVLSRNSGPDYYYKLQYTDRYGEIVVYGCYPTLELAVKCGIKLAAEECVDEFEIEKDIMPASEAVIDDIEDMDSDTKYDFATARFRADGKLLCCSARCDVPKEEIEDPLEERFHIIPHPFRRGDIVRYVRGREGRRSFGLILEQEDDEMSAQKDRMESLQKWYTPCWENVSIQLVNIDLETGLIWDNDGQVVPTELEFYQIPEDTQDLGERVLLSLSDLLKGKPTSLQFIQNGLMKLQEKYDDNKCYSLITGLDIKKSRMGYIFDSDK